MTIKELQYINSTYRSSSLASSARDNGVTVSAISQAISNVEKEFNITLFVRSGRSSVPTEDCLLFMNLVKPVLEAWENMTGELKDFSLKKNTELSVSMPPGIYMSVYPHIMGILHGINRNVHVNILERSYQAILTLVSQDYVDLGIVQGPVSLEGVGYKELGRTRLLFGVSSKHPFAQAHPYRGLDNLEKVSITEFAESSFSMIQKSRVCTQIDEMLQRVGFKPNIVFTSTYFTTIKDYIKFGNSVGFVDEMFVRNESRDSRISYYIIEELDITRPTYAVFSLNRGTSKIKDEFMDAVRRYLEM